MEPVCLFHDDQDHVHLGSGLKLRSFISEGLHHLPQQRHHCATVTGDADAHSKVELLKNDPDAEISLGTGEPTEGRKNRKKLNSSGTCGTRSRCTHLLSSTEEDIRMEGVREDLDEIDATEMCFDGCVISSQTISNALKQETRLEYGDTYLESLTERDGMLIESVPASSPASFFQSDTIHVPSDNSLVGRGDSWRDLPPTQQEAEYHTSSTEFDLGEERAADSIFPEIVLVTKGGDGISDGNFGVKDTQFMELPTPGPIDAEENSQSSKKHMENISHPEPKNITRGSQLRDKMTRVHLCLRSVLSDPITGAFLDDAMVAQCGHSFGSHSLQKVMETHICVACGAAASPNSLVPNFALRAAVLAYKHEDHLQMTSIRGLKRRREVSEPIEGSEVKRTEREHWSSAEHNSTDNCRSKAVQFPFLVSDKVLIKGNKRTPERFVGREAVITTQCLNGWYLVKTLDSGECVRLQYRSLEKLGDVQMPCTSGVECFSEHGGDSSGSPAELSQDPTKALANKGLEFGSPDGKRNTENRLLRQHGLEKNLNTAGFSERDLVRPPYSSNAHIDGRGISNSEGRVTSKCTLEDVLSNQGRNVEHQIGSLEEGPKISENCRDQHLDTERRGTAIGQTVSAAMVEKFRTDLLNGISTFHDESGDEQMVQVGQQNETSSKVWFRTKKDFLDSHASSGEQVTPTKMLSRDGDATGMGGPIGNRDQESENNSLRTRSRRTSLHPRNSLPVGVCGQDADPYRKVYSSGRRRGGKVVMVIPDDTVADSDVKDRGQGTTKSYSEGLHDGGSGGGKHGRDMKVKSTSEILEIMKKDMLKLEKQIPRSYLLNSWRSDRITWRKGVKASCTVLELGDLVRDFRYSLLLATAGGMADEELEKRLRTISESGDVDLLVSLWGKLYDDVYKCVESRPKTNSSLAHTLWRRIFTVEARNVHELDFGQSIGSQPMPTGETTTASVAASVGECQRTSGSEVKTLLASTMSLLQKQSRMELLSVKQALEREKRHIMAKLAKLEEIYVKSGSTSLETRSRGPKLDGEGSNEAAQRPRKSSCSEPPDDVTDEAHEGVSRPQDADGEATDLSDSD